MKAPSNRFRRAAELAGFRATLSDGSLAPMSEERIAEIAAGLLDAARREVARHSRQPGAYSDAREMCRALRVALWQAEADRKRAARAGEDGR